jgi:hypothetical protein
LQPLLEIYLPLSKEGIGCATKERSMNSDLSLGDMSNLLSREVSSFCHEKGGGRGRRAVNGEGRRKGRKKEKGKAERHVRRRVWREEGKAAVRGGEVVIYLRS